jgi:UDP-2-acetamido-3-amino-2,3-dideoxy-glucuronate N-acetyltransferase
MPVNCTLGPGAKIFYPDLVNIYGGDTTLIGAETTVGPFVEIQKGVIIGKACKIQSHAFICEGVTVEDGVFIGHGVMFINDRFPRATSRELVRKTEADWKLEPTLIRRGAALGSNCTILCGLEIGEDAIIGAGSVVTKNIPAGAIVAGNPARVISQANLRVDL